MLDSSPTRPVLIAGAGIGGLALALTLQQIGVACLVYEAVTDLQPLGLGIKLQPNWAIETLNAAPPTSAAGVR